MSTYDDGITCTQCWGIKVPEGVTMVEEDGEVCEHDHGNWPTSEQFDMAAQHGTEYALAEIANGNDGPRESPLSGEWAGEIVPRTVACNVGFEPGDNDFEAVDELANAWERCYNDVWRTHESTKG